MRIHAYLLMCLFFFFAGLIELICCNFEISSCHSPFVEFIYSCSLNAVIGTIPRGLFISLYIDVDIVFRGFLYLFTIITITIILIIITIFSFFFAFLRK